MGFPAQRSEVSIRASVFLRYTLTFQTQINIIPHLCRMAHGFCWVQPSSWVGHSFAMLTGRLCSVCSSHCGEHSCFSLSSGLLRPWLLSLNWMNCISSIFFMLICKCWISPLTDEKMPCLFLQWEEIRKWWAVRLRCSHTSNWFHLIWASGITSTF